MLRRFLRDPGVKKHLQQHISELVTQLDEVAAAHRIEQLVGLLQQVAAQRVVSLLLSHGPEVRSLSIMATASTSRSPALDPAPR